MFIEIRVSNWFHFKSEEGLYTAELIIGSNILFIINLVLYQGPYNGQFMICSLDQILKSKSQALFLTSY